MNRNVKKWARLSLYTLVFVFSGCQNKDTLQGDGGRNVDPGTQETKAKDIHSVHVDISTDQQVKDAIADLSARTGVAADAINVKQARSVQWASGALGCPKPGKAYTQAMIPGVLLLLEVGGRQYRYHGRLGQASFYCPDDRAQEPAYGPGKDFM